MNHEQLKTTILLIDDDRKFTKAACTYLADEGLYAIAAHSRSEALEIYKQHPIKIVLLDQRLPDGSGVSLCQPFLQQDDALKIIFITAYPSFENAVLAIKAGAYDYLSKPLELEALSHAIRRAFRTIELECVDRVQNYHNEHERLETRLIGAQTGLADINTTIDRAAFSQVPIFITGETGTGKNVVAKVLHYRDQQRKGAFIATNCAAIPESLLEAELFGYVKGAFTGASQRRRGVFEMADGGTLFLDEIGLMPISLQPKILCAIEDKCIRPVGSEKSIPIDVRIIAATNADPAKAISQGRLREDLYYRLNVVHIHLPALRKRRQDIPLLCKHFINELGSGREVSFAEGEVEKLMNYQWPGNVRELKNVIDRALVLQGETALRPSELLGWGQTMPSYSIANTTPAKMLSLGEVERRHILAVVKQCGGNHTHAARILGISLSTLKRKLIQYSQDDNSNSNYSKVN
ncbi:MAG: sigma-54-dependent Fis family transcriptional regulator [Deltaproteobacteria bacterium]|nr:sigma-54-dependent Fis family transcriptional regulator [Deltaproteobacteria bacterium]